MPQRTTPFQMVVHFVRKHWASPDVTVSESRMLKDRATQEMTEVDIVVEGALDGEEIMIGIEVNEQGRRSGPKWVREMIMKHQALPTTLLLLVSKEGFTKPALRMLGDHRGKVRAIKPEIVTVDGEPAVSRLLSEGIGMKPESVGVVLRKPDGSLETIAGHKEFMVYDHDGREIAQLAFLVDELMSLPAFGNMFSTEFEAHTDREDVERFACVIPLGAENYFLCAVESDQFHKIERILLEGNFIWSQDALELTHYELGGRRYAATEDGTLFGRPAVWVSTTECGDTKLSWRMIDQASRVEIPPTATSYFPGLANIDFEGYQLRDYQDLTK